MPQPADCLRDGLQYGQWIAGPRRESSPCARLEYVNRTCDRGHAFDEARLCAALRCRSVLFVGDSLVRGLFLALVGELMGSHNKAATVAATATQPTHYDAAGSACSATWSLRWPSALCQTNASAQPSCRRGVNISFVGSMHLDIDKPFDPHAYNLDAESSAQKRCLGQSDLHWNRRLRDERQLLIISRGAHVQQYASVRGVDVRARAPWHAERARVLASKLRGESLGVIFVMPHWGIIDFKHESSKSAARPATFSGPIATNWSWHLIPMIGQVTAEGLRQGLDPDELLVVDPRRALDMRPDCRYDFLHVRPEVLIGSTLRQLVAGLSLWSRH